MLTSKPLPTENYGQAEGLHICRCKIFVENIIPSDIEEILEKVSFELFYTLLCITRSECLAESLFITTDSKVIDICIQHYHDK